MYVFFIIKSSQIIIPLFWTRKRVPFCGKIKPVESADVSTKVSGLELNVNKIEYTTPKSNKMAKPKILTTKYFHCLYASN